MTIHSQDESVIREFALQKPVSRLLVNTPGALGGVGATTGLNPALTLGCGAVGGSATSDNVSPLNLINIRRVAYGIMELYDLRRQSPVKEGTVKSKALQMPAGNARTSYQAGNTGNGSADITQDDIDRITQAIMKRLGY
jgi:hypothetical protein